MMNVLNMNNTSITLPLVLGSVLFMLCSYSTWSNNHILPDHSHNYFFLCCLKHSNIEIHLDLERKSKDNYNNKQVTEFSELSLTYIFNLSLDTNKRLLQDMEICFCSSLFNWVGFKWSRLGLYHKGWPKETGVKWVISSCLWKKVMQQHTNCRHK